MRNTAAAARPPITAGRLNRRVTILRRAAGQDSAGQPLGTWAELATLWADIRTPAGLASAERVAADRQASVQAYSVRIRYRTDITAADRVRIDGAVHGIAAVALDHAGRRYTDLVCTAGALG